MININKIIFSLFFILILLSPSLGFASKEDYMVLLHGLNRTSDDMIKLEEKMQDEGFEVINIGYPSTDYSIAELTEMIKEVINEDYRNKAKRINFITFSIGGVILRDYLSKYKPANLNKVVMIGPPNQGSEVSDFLRGNPVVESIYGPAGREVGTSEDSICWKLPQKADFQLGIVAGNSTVNPFFSTFVIPGDDDGIVAIENTKLRGMKDHIVVDASHPFMPMNEEVIRQVDLFIKNGKFDHNHHN